MKKSEKIFVNILDCMFEIANVKIIFNVLVLAIGIMVQCFWSDARIPFLSEDKIEYLTEHSLVLSMAATIGLSTIIVFGFNLSSYIQQSWRTFIKEHGLGSINGFKKLRININYWLLIVLVLLYICIAMKWFMLYYILLTYDVLCFLGLISKLYLVDKVGYIYFSFFYQKQNYNNKVRYLRNILQNSVEKDGRINVGAVKTYIELLWGDLKEKSCENADKYKEQEFYDKAKLFFSDTMDQLLLDRMEQSSMLLSMIRIFCNIIVCDKEEASNKVEIESQIMLSIMISYALNREKNIDIDYIYKELINWNDPTLGLRYSIAVSRLEYLFTVKHTNDYILLSDNIFKLYCSITNDKTYERFVSLLWYLWCHEDGEAFLIHVGKMNRFIELFQKDITIFNFTEARNFYTLVKGLKY